MPRRSGQGNSLSAVGVGKKVGKIAEVVQTKSRENSCLLVRRITEVHSVFVPKDRIRRVGVRISAYVVL